MQQTLPENCAGKVAPGEETPHMRQSPVHVHAYGVDKTAVLQELSQLKYWRTLSHSLIGMVALPCFVPPPSLKPIIKLGPGLQAHIEHMDIFGPINKGAWERAQEDVQNWSGAPPMQLNRAARVFFRRDISPIA